MRAVDVSEILGLNATKESDDNANAEDPSTERQPLLAELWPSRLYQPLTKSVRIRGSGFMLPLAAILAHRPCWEYARWKPAFR